MIASVVWNLDPNKEQNHLWVFYKYLHMAILGDGALIAKQQFFIDPTQFIAEGYEDPGIGAATYAEYNVPQLQDFDRIPTAAIPESLEEQAIKQFGSRTNAWMHLLTKPWEPLVHCLLECVERIESERGQPVEAFLSWVNLPSLSAVAKKRNLPVMHLEWGPLRPPSYRKTAYLDFTGLFDRTSCEQRYEQFLREHATQPLPILQRAELLAVFLTPGHMRDLRLLHTQPLYEMGLACGYTIDCITLAANSMLNNIELIMLARRHYTDSDLLLRTHPYDPAMPRMLQLQNDKSATPAEFVSKCRRVAAVFSNVAFEAMLWGRDAYVLGGSPFAFKAARSLDGVYQPVELEFLNFIAFGYLVPFELLNDAAYLRWRLTNPSETEIYQKHLSHYLSSRRLSTEVLLDTGENRLMLMLEYQGFDINGRPLDSSGNLVEREDHNTEINASLMYIAEILAQQTGERETKDKIYIELLDELSDPDAAGGVQHLPRYSAYVSFLEKNQEKTHEYIVALEQAHQDTRQYIKSLENNQKRVSTYAASLEEVQKNLQQYIEILEVNQREAQGYITSLEDTNRNLQEYCKAKKTYAEALEQEQRGLQQQLNSIESSVSWKVTEPLRTIWKLLTKLTRRE